MSSIEKAISKLGKKNDGRVEKSSNQSSQEFDSMGMGDRIIIDDNASFRQIEINPEQLNGFGKADHKISKQLVEEFRVIKRPILKNAFDKQADYIEHRNLIMVTSALPGEGKTFTSINLAISIAEELDKTVLLIDCDATRSGVSRALNFDSGKGLSDLLTDNNLMMQDILIKTNMPNLSILSSGSMKINAHELLASEYMSKIVSELSDRYPDRIIIFDSPPLLVTSEARVLAGMMGQILIVVESEKTSQSAIEDAIEVLDSSKVMGFVLNKSERPLGSSYGYGYGFNYGSSNKK